MCPRLRPQPAGFQQKPRACEIHDEKSEWDSSVIRKYKGLHLSLDHKGLMFWLTVPFPKD